MNEDKHTSIILTVDIHAADLLLHDAGVDLTHVTALVRLLDLSDVQSPVVVVMRDPYPGVVRHKLVMKGQDRLVVRFHPADLNHQKYY